MKKLELTMVPPEGLELNPPLTEAHFIYLLIICYLVKALKVEQANLIECMNLQTIVN